jgi:chromosome segregation ATPase
MEYREQKKKKPLQNTTNTVKSKASKPLGKLAPKKAAEPVADNIANSITAKPPATGKTIQKSITLYRKPSVPVQPLSEVSELEFPRNDELQVAELQAKNDQVLLNIEIDTKNQEILTLRGLTTRLQAELDHIKQDLVRYSAQEEKLNEQLKSQRLDMDHVVTSLREQLNQQKQVIADKESLIYELSNMVDTLKLEISDLNENPKRYANMWVSQLRVDDLEKTNSDLDEELLEKITTISHLEAENEKLKSHLEAASTTHSQLESKCSELQQENKELMDRLFAEKQHSKTQLSQFSVTLQKKQDLISQLEEKTGKLGIEDELRDAYECIDLLQTQESRLQNELEAMGSKVLYLETQILSHTITNNALSSNESELCEALKESLKENEELHLQLDKRNTRISQLESDLQALQEATEIMEQEMAVLEDKLNTQQAQESRILELESEITSKVITLNLLEEEKCQLEAALHSTLKENETLHMGVANYTEKLAQSETKLAQYVQAVGNNPDIVFQLKKEIEHGPSQSMTQVTGINKVQGKRGTNGVKCPTLGSRNNECA